MSSTIEQIVELLPEHPEGRMGVILALIPDLSFTEKIQLNSELATFLKKEAKTGKIGKAIKKENKAKDPSAPKRKPKAGTLAWIEFHKHCKTTFPERYEGVGLESKRYGVTKAIREEDMPAYTKFVEDFKAKHAEDEAEATEDASETEGAAAAPAPKAAKSKAGGAKAKPAAKAVESEAEGEAAEGAEEKPKRKISPEQLEKMKAAAKLAREKKAAAKASESAAAGGAPAPAKAEKTEAKAPKEKKQKKTAAKAPKKDEEIAPKITIEGKEYFLDTASNTLYEVGEDDTWGSEVGTYQPGNEDEPILYAA
jgi:hypothetical protein